MSRLTKLSGWVDIHCHFSPPSTEEERLRICHAIRSENFMIPEPWQWNAEEILSYMDRQGIAMQILSNIPTQHQALRSSNEYGAGIVKKYPTRFGLLAALPTDNVLEAIREVERADRVLSADGFAVVTCYNGIHLGDESLDPLWDTLNKREKAVVHIHPNGYQRSVMGRPTVLVELAFDTTRTIMEMVYNGVFRRYPNIIWVIAHCGGALPALSGRLLALGTEIWVPNPKEITEEEMRTQFATLFVDTAATASASLLLPAMEMTGKRGEHIIYGSDCGVPCSTEETMDQNVKRLLAFEGLTDEEKEAIGHWLEELLPAAAQRMREERR